MTPLKRLGLAFLLVLTFCSCAIARTPQEGLPSGDLTGSWTVEKVAGYAYSPHPGPDEERKTIGQTLVIASGKATFLDRTGPISSPKRWDTQGTEWLESFRTNAKELKLPRYVNAVDTDFGAVIPVQRDRIPDRHGKYLVLGTPSEAERAPVCKFMTLWANISRSVAL